MRLERCYFLLTGPHWMRKKVIIMSGKKKKKNWDEDFFAGVLVHLNFAFHPIFCHKIDDSFLLWRLNHRRRRRCQQCRHRRQLDNTSTDSIDDEAVDVVVDDALCQAFAYRSKSKFYSVGGLYQYKRFTKSTHGCQAFFFVSAGPYHHFLPL